MPSRTSRRRSTAGLDVDDFAPQLAFFFNAHNNFLEEVAKFRAARRLWATHHARAVQAHKTRAAGMLRFHTQTGGSTLTAQQPENNVVRVTLQALAAVLGGTQSLHTNSRDEALALPTEESVRVALRTQQIIAYESGVADTVDPLGGSYCVERLTDEIERRGVGVHRRDRRDGRRRARPSSAATCRTRSRTSAYKLGRSIEAGDRVIVGVNRFVTGEEPWLQLLRVDESVAARQVAKLQAVRRRRGPGGRPAGPGCRRTDGRRPREPDARHPRGRTRLREHRRDL